MRRQIAAVLGTALGLGLALAPSIAPAATRASGAETFNGVLVVSGESGGRSVVTSLIVGKGVFTGSGRIVEVPNRPSDPDSVSRDDLVFPGGKLHVVSTSKAPNMSLDPQTCALTFRIPQTAKIDGGTGRFRHAAGSFVSSVRGRGVAPRSPDGSCAAEGALLLEVDIVAARGTLSF